VPFQSADLFRVPPLTQHRLTGLGAILKVAVNSADGSGSCSVAVSSFKRLVGHADLSEAVACDIAATVRNQ
jgi:hypothetical protein